MRSNCGAMFINEFEEEIIRKKQIEIIRSCEIAKMFEAVTLQSDEFVNDKCQK